MHMHGCRPAASARSRIIRTVPRQVFERLIEPFCSGVYAGDPSKLSMKAAFGRIWRLEGEGGSLVGGAIKLFQDAKKNPPPPRDKRLPPKPAGQTVGSFRTGLQGLTNAIGENIKDNVRLNWKLSSITRDASSGLFTLSYDTPEGPTSVQARTIALTVPAYTAADLLQTVASSAADALRSFDYPPVAAVTLSYPMDAILDSRKDSSGAVPGFGQLHPRSQEVTTLGTIYSSSLFPGRCPDGNMLILNYIGGATNRGIVNQPHDKIAKQVDSDLRIMLIKKDAAPGKVVGIRVWPCAIPQFNLGHLEKLDLAKRRMTPVVGIRVWPRAIPQFNLGHLEKLDVAKSALADAGWNDLLLGGNYVFGVALGKCVEYGYEYAADIAQRVSKAKVVV
ncbi:hypothetical protein FOA52_011443 [Chlamydomonas sp. UWO 241]|nr:hypothetical protein FOA52_011443 [Chlamydomonas sp. UWO 241]